MKNNRILEDNQSLNKRGFFIPDNIQKNLQKRLTSLGQYKENDGYKRLNSLLNPSYNKRSSTPKNKGEISYGELKRFKHDYESIPDKKSLNAQIIGGDEMYNWVTSELSSQANAVQQVNKVKKSSNIRKSQTIPIKPTKSIKPENVRNAVITIGESKKKLKITESQFKRLFTNKKATQL